MQDNQHEQLFTELTSAEAAAVEGSGRFSEAVRFDAYDQTQKFNVRPGGTIKLTSNVNGGNPPGGFKAAIFNVKTRNENKKPVSYGRDTTVWTDIRGGDYIIKFTDENDNKIASGSVTVDYTS